MRAKIVSRPEDYRWSSHRAVLGEVPAPDWLAVDDVLVEFGSNRDLARAAYREFVDAAIGIETNVWRDLVGQIYLGSEDWPQQVRSQVDLKPRVDEHPRVQRVVGEPSMDLVIRSVADMFSVAEAEIRAGRGGAPRMIAAWIAWHEGHLTNAEIAAGLRLRSSGHVSRLASQCDQELRRHPRLREYVQQCLSTLGRDHAEGKV